MPRFDLRPGRQHHRALDRILQLAHVAGPVVRDQQLHRVGREAVDRLGVLLRIALEEELRERRNVAPAIAQRRHLERDHVQPVIQIFAEPAFRHLLRQVAIRRRDHPHVDANRLRAAHALELVLLQKPQQLDLARRRDLADLVEEQRSAIRQLKPPVLAHHRARERPLLVPEQLALEQRLRERRTMQLDERPGRAR